MEKQLGSQSFQEKVGFHREELAKLGFINESGELTRQVVTHSDSFRDELDGRLTYEPDYATIGNLPEMHFLKDVAQAGEEPVYPHHGESNDIIYAIKRFFPGRKFSAAIECFAGAGHGGIKLRNSDVLNLNAPIHSVDINPRAIALATANSTLNDANIQYQEVNVLRDGFHSLPDQAKKLGETIYFGNAPFALTTPKVHVEVCRDGGSDGLKKTIAFIQASLEDSSPKDAIVGVAYTRVGTSGNYEFEDRLKALQKDRNFTYKIELVEGSKLWRGYNGKKEQDNPMDLNMMKTKGKEGSDAYQEYERMAANYKEEGWDKLAYIRYAIQVSEPATDQIASTHQQVTDLLK